FVGRGVMLIKHSHNSTSGPTRRGAARRKPVREGPTECTGLDPVRGGPSRCAEPEGSSPHRATTSGASIVCGPTLSVAPHAPDVAPLPPRAPDPGGSRP